ncbi:MAG TPA: HD domain-containing phosphohydrolase [Desulfohalobiaceae bacterium]|nr:HD domain-containing phosphohydrolase [Desulfohalobiaceae bacterium]
MADQRVNMFILIAEDDQVSRKSISYMLQKQGHEVIETCDGVQAWQKMQERDSPRLLVLDIMMPNMDGFELCRKIRLNYTYNPPYIIFLTAKTEKEDIVQGLRIGANDYIAKPFNFEELEARVKVGQRMLDMQSDMLNEIDERKKVETELCKAYEKLNKLVKLNADGIMVVDLNGVILFINPAGANMLGLMEEEVLGKHFGYPLTPGESTEIELLSQNGQTIVVELRIQGTEWEERDALLISFRNITDRKLIEESLRKSEERYKKLIHSSPDAVALVDEVGKFLTVNPAMAHRFGLTPQELEGKTHHEVMPESLAESRLEKAIEAIEDEKLVYFVDKRKDMHIENYYVPIPVFSGQQRSFQIISRDITQTIQAQNELEQTLNKLNQSIQGIFQVLSATLELRDAYTAGHQKRVTHLACAIAWEMDLEEERIQGLYFAGMVHDIGKISIPAEILAKPNRLTDIEFGLIKEHVQSGYNILKDIEFPWPIADIVVQHHERLDGSGYPAGLSGEDILQESRILAVADVVEAMTSHRPYRPGLGLEVALKEIEKRKGLLFDEEVVDTCLKLFRENGYTFED